MSLKVQIGPSLLAADMGNLEEGAKKAQAAGGDYLHIDIMDAHFVPNLSMGPAVVAMAKRHVQIPLSVHLMMTNPDQYLNKFADAGADTILIHIEAKCDVPGALDHMRTLGIRVGITLNPETPANMLFPVLDKVDEVLCMSVHPGYGGQTFIPDVLPKIRLLRERSVMLGRHPDIMVDGGINTENIGPCAAEGANSFVAGTSLYSAEDMPATLAKLRSTAEKALQESGVEL